MLTRTLLKLLFPEQVLYKQNKYFLIYILVKRVSYGDAGTVQENCGIVVISEFICIEHDLCPSSYSYCQLWVCASIKILTHNTLGNRLA